MRAAELSHVLVDADVVYADARASAFEDMQGLITRSIVRTVDGPVLSIDLLRSQCRSSAASYRVQAGALRQKRIHGHG